MNDIAKTTNSLNPLELIQTALSTGQSSESLEKLMDLQERWQKNEAEKEFNLALSEFAQKSPKILKDSVVSFGSGKTSYKHATLSNVVSAIQPVMSELGLSHRWKTSQNEHGISVECIITHKSGHSESTSLTAPSDNSGSKNAIQAIGSTVTYLQRYTLLSALGLAVFEDDDAVGYERTYISDKQVTELENLTENLSDERKKGFYKYIKSAHKASSINDLSINSFSEVKRMLVKS